MKKLEDKRKNLRRHIQAARDWLTQAEKSIEREDDLQGDLKLMLAKAELKNAEKHQNRSRLIKFLSFATAAAIAFGVFYFNDDSTKISKNTLPVESASKLITTSPDNVLTSDQPTEQLNLNQAETVDELSETLEEIDPVNEDQQEEIYFEEVDQKSAEIIEVEPSTNSNYISDEPIETFEENNISAYNPRVENYTVESATPSEDMQRLMQSAGQILRAE